MTQQTRPEGYYWVLHHEKWIIAELCGNDWYIIGGEGMFDEDDFKKIGVKIPSHNKIAGMKKQIDAAYEKGKSVGYHEGRNDVYNDLSE